MDIMKFTALTAFVLAVSACNTVTKKDLGLVKEAPNEFMVMSRAPLSLPPEYDVRPVTQPVAAAENGEKRLKRIKWPGCRKVSAVLCALSVPTAAMIISENRLPQK